jgi:hypothetical protein
MTGYRSYCTVDDCLALHGTLRVFTTELGFVRTHKLVSVGLFPQYEQSREKVCPPGYIRALQKSVESLHSAMQVGELSGSCLSLSMMVQALLYSSGLDTELSLGVAKIDHRFFSHSWVQLSDGKIIDASSSTINYNRLRVVKRFSMLVEAREWAGLSCSCG